MKNINSRAVIVTIITSLFIFKSTPSEAFSKSQTLLKNVAVSLESLACRALTIDPTLRDYLFKIDIKKTVSEDSWTLYNRPGFLKISGSIEDDNGYKLNGALSVYRLKNNSINNDDIIFNELK